jgi:isopentenyl phosphate kinase
MMLENHPSQNLVFLKLGGSLITDKEKPRTARLQILKRLVEEMAAALDAQPGLQILLGHGSGSFGHVSAKKYGTRQGVSGKEQWLGFIEVWRDAQALNHLVIETLHAAGLPAISISPSASVIAAQGNVLRWDLTPIKYALQQELIPVIYGDVVFDAELGGTILSTEDLFDYLARRLLPKRVLLAGLEPGVWADFPVCNQLVSEINQASYPGLEASLGGSAAADVTGGMRSKVVQSLRLAEEIQGLEVWIFSGIKAGILRKALSGAHTGTVIRS